jgi:tetratricopeptide (TPR) repeat protein
MQNAEAETPPAGGGPPPAANTVNTGNTERALTAAELLELGLKFLLELNYEQAIVYLTRVIEIEPRNVRAYVGRGTAYVFWNEQLEPAKADFEAAIEIDDACVDAYLGLVDVYIRMSEFDRALEIAELGYAKTGDGALRAKIDELKGGAAIDSSNQMRKRTLYNADGTIQHYMIFEYNSRGQRSAWTTYMPDGTIISRQERGFDERGQETGWRAYDPDGSLRSYATYVFDERDLRTEQYTFGADGTLRLSFRYEYDDEGRGTVYYSYNSDGEMINYWVSVYDDDGNLAAERRYLPDGTFDSVAVVE